jgi:oxygen-independent coproporphyrinogen III oxidase
MIEPPVAVAPYRHVYVHVPFCARRCSYCDFSIAVRRRVPVEAFAAAIGSEYDVRGRPLTAPLDTLYFGGGTPSRLGAAGVTRVIDTLRERVSLAPGCEVTLEANPEDIVPASVASWRHDGITRLSIGVQSFDDAALQWMHRVHDGAAARRAVEVARDGGLAAYSLDLIFAVPGTLRRDWARDLDAALGLEPDHISLYGLTIEPHTPLGRWSDRGEVDLATDERYAAEFLLAHERLTAAGYEHYEVSNFARPGRRAVHNSAYWTGLPYLGLGPSAHGFDGRTRRWNRSAYAAWDRAVSAGQDPQEGAELLTDENRHAERVYLGLRTIDGLVLSDAEHEVAEAWIERGWLECTVVGGEKRFRCTPNGWLLLDRLASDLTAVPSRS